MKPQTAALSIAAVLVVACSGGGSPTATGASPTVTAAVPTAAPATPRTTPAAVVTAAPATPTASVVAESPLEGTWTTGETTCEQQNAAVENAGFTSEQIQDAGWDAETCGNLMHGSTFVIRFSGERLIAFNDGVAGWDGTFRVVDSDTFEAGDSGDYYITYEFAIDGDELTIDMTRDDYPTTSEAELAGEMLAQTVIYESSPFTREQ